MALFKKRVKAQQVKTMQAFEEAVASGRPVFVDFMKFNCGPCQVMDGIVNELADEFQDEAEVLKVNVEHVPDLFAMFKVKSTPTFILITPNGTGFRQRFRHSGLVKKDQLVNQLERAVKAH